MGDFDSNISDDELRRRLVDEFNFTPGPITDSTRGIYIKKLHGFIKERVGKESPRRKTVAQFSTNSNQENGRRTPVKESILESGRKSRQTPKQTTPKAINSSIAFTRSPRRRNTVNTPSLEISPNVTARKKKSVNSPLVAYSSEESADDESTNEANEGSGVLLNYMKSKESSLTNTLRSASTKVPLPRMIPPSSPLAVETRVSPRRTAKKSYSQPSVNINSGSYLSNFSDSETENDVFNDGTSTESIRDRLLKHRQLATMRQTEPSQVVTQSNDFVEENNFYTLNDSSSSSNWISLTILGLVIVFFALILSFYFYSRINFKFFGKHDERLDMQVEFDSMGLNAPICGLSSSYSTSSLCLNSRKNVTAGLFLVKCIQNFIQRDVFRYLCDSSSSKKAPFSYSVEEIRNEILPQTEKFAKFVGNDPPIDDPENAVLLSLEYAITLIELNPQWNMRVVRKEDNYFLQIDPDTYQIALPFSCQAYLMLSQTIKKILISIIVIAIVSAVLKFVHRKRKQAAEERELIYDLMEKSLDLLQSPDNPQSMPVIHIRDMLFSAQERQSAKSMKIWAKVVKFVEENESRVKVGWERIDGDDYKTWKWIASSKGNTSSGSESPSTTMKTGPIEWQGQAFGSDENRGKEATSNTNQIVNDSSQITSNKNSNPAAASNFVAPTCFLKVRNMYNPETHLNPNWKANIENAILEKCMATAVNNKHGVLHIHVDDSGIEGVVYIKCDSIESATVAFRALHGWWCERKLVSVRFLKEERYYARFPEARTFTEPLRVRYDYR
ncbi:inner nuclear membrane protein Man1-like protein [Dinothrombium tinctorium]|uniref:Inner nuclear membrane protein Man1-like protein n=1 Tax=Dinothrombium tinctorium TaxID=1965070 RepID=A0A3S3S7U1_9ACAR|nr:inner nuclear membrane protein Man1-like protein [Dinothrombium tinctorium]